MACGSCHTSAVQDSNAGTAHYDGNIDVINSYPADVAKHAVGSYTGNCTTTCHSTSLTSVATPTWGQTATCSSCHASAPGTGSHTGHLAASAVVTGCGNCHNGAVQDSNPGTAHGDQDIDVTNSYPPNVAKHAVGSYTGNCTTTCHSTSLTSIATPTWGQTTTCSSCHASAPATGSHTNHLAVSGVNCGSCHNGAVQGSNAGTAHLDGDIDVTNGYPTNVAKHVVGTYSGSCSTASCHGSSSATWGPNTTNNTCTKCHGTQTVTVTAANYQVIAPPVSTASVTGNLTGVGQVSDNVKVGAHQTHLLYSNGVRSTGVETIQGRCGFCHTVPTVGSHANGSSAPLFTGLSVSAGATPTYTGTTCNNTYCHNPAGKTLNALNAGLATAPSWTNAAYIADGTLKTQANCNVCHKSPGTVAGTILVTSTTDHSAFTIASDCSGCHGHNGGTTGIAGQRHIDGIKYGGGNCDSCHHYDVVGATYAASVWTGGTWGKSVTGSNAEGFGAHAKHINHIKTRLAITAALDPVSQTYGSNTPANVCGVCHTNTGADHATSGSTARTINFGGSTTYQFGPSTPLYNGNSTNSSSVNPKTCSNISCHFQTTPVWNAY